MGWLKWAEKRERGLLLNKNLSENIEFHPMLIKMHTFKTLKLDDNPLFQESNKSEQLNYLLHQVFREVCYQNAIVLPSDFFSEINDFSDDKEGGKTEENSFADADKISVNNGLTSFDPKIIHSIYKACAFTGLIMFLHITRYVKSDIIREYIKNMSQLYENLSSELKEQHSTDDAVTMRQYIKRLNDTRMHPRKHTEGTTFTDSMKYEWKLYFLLKNGENDILADTFKRLGNLLNDIRPVLRKYGDKDELSNVDAASAYGEIEYAFKKYQSKLHKIKYNNYLDLIRVICDHIESDKSYYGNNIYRLEKELFPYVLTHNVDRFLKNSKDDLFSMKLTILNSVTYSKLYDQLINVENIEELPKYVALLSVILDDFTVWACYMLDDILDEMVNRKIEKDYKERKPKEKNRNKTEECSEKKECKKKERERWIDFLKNDAYKRAQSVFYSPEEIIWVTEERSQEAFEKCLTYPILEEIRFIKESISNRQVNHS